jgi:carbohydrate kinase (thermoresistant glucokinase family)
MTGDVASASRGSGPLLVVMGVSAAGKSTVARTLAAQLGISYVDADDLHPTANLEKMARGVPLSDEDRWPWLDRVGQELKDAPAEGVVMACSALRRSYRDRLRGAAPNVGFIHLTGTRELLRERAAGRVDHFMPATLLDSQLDTLERLEGDETGIRIDIDATVENIALAAREWVASRDCDRDKTGAA